jgi:hypothetical protein
MASVYLVWHVTEHPDGADDVLLIGVYSSREKAQEAVARLGRQPGFVDAPEGFHISEYRVDQDHWVEGFVTVGGQ